MNRSLDPCQLIERSIIKKYRKTLWNPFIAAMKRYDLIQAGDRIAICISGGKDSMLLAKLMQELHRHSEVPFDLHFLVMDPGYNEINRKKIEDNAALLRIPITIFETDIFDATSNLSSNPCYLCARMRRGHLYRMARELGCNKIALGHHMSDVIETTVMAMFYGAQLQGMMPKLHSQNFPGMELIRPLYCILEKDILAWCSYHQLDFIRCACRFTEQSEAEGKEQSAGKRREVKNLILSLKKTNPDIEKSIFSALHSVWIDTFPGFKQEGHAHSFLEQYGEKKEGTGRLITKP
jgi:hypothetical protein